MYTVKFITLPYTLKVYCSIKREIQHKVMFNWFLQIVPLLVHQHHALHFAKVVEISLGKI